MLTATAGFRHDSIGTARQALTNLGAASGAFTITATEDLSAVSASSLASYDVLFFALTSGELTFTAEQKAAILAFVSQGGGFMGAHSATDTLYTWPEYQRPPRRTFPGAPMDADGNGDRRRSHAPGDVDAGRPVLD